MNNDLCYYQIVESLKFSLDKGLADYGKPPDLLYFLAAPDRSWQASMFLVLQVFFEPLYYKTAGQLLEACGLSSLLVDIGSEITKPSEDLEGQIQKAFASSSVSGSLLAQMALVSLVGHRRIDLRETVYVLLAEIAQADDLAYLRLSLLFS